MTYNLQFNALALVALLFIGCSKSEDSISEINQSEVKLKFDEEFAFNVVGARDIQWSSSDEFVGVIDPNGKFIAKHIGETDIVGKSGNRNFNAKVVVEPYITDVILPVLDFGTASQQIKEKEQRAFISEDASQLRFMGQGKRENRIYYNLRNGVLDASVISFKETGNFQDSLAKFFDERYERIEESDDRYTYVNKEQTIGVSVRYNFSIGIHATWVASSYTVPKN